MALFFYSYVIVIIIIIIIIIRQQVGRVCVACRVSRARRDRAAFLFSDKRGWGVSVRSSLVLVLYIYILFEYPLGKAEERGGNAHFGIMPQIPPVSSGHS